MSTNHKVFANPKLLTTPRKRAGWSDRTALLMAEMSLLAYLKFEESDTGNVLPQDELDGVYERLMGTDIEAARPGSEETEQSDQTEDDTPIPSEGLELLAELRRGGFRLAGLVSDKDTDSQAFIATSDPDSQVRPFGDEKIVILSFRGTKTAKDWRINAKFRLGDARGKTVHTGFQQAFDAVKPAISGRLDPFLDAGYTLYVTGHSLGGALAIIATRDIGLDSTGACYTFGQPRVARFGFAEEIKTPIYRVINSNDLVPRVPPAYLITILVWAMKRLNVPLMGLLRGRINRYEQYVHHGDMRYLRRTPAGDFSKLQVLSNPSVIYRTMWFISALMRNPRSPINNHDIHLYADKLAAYAKRRLT